MPRFADTPASAEDEEGGRGDAAQGRRGRALVIAATALLVLSLAPDLIAVFAPPDAPAGSPVEFDVANTWTWYALIGRGLVGMRDFFYPYGGQWMYQLVPAGPALQWLADAAMLALAASALWRLSGKRAVRVVACLLILTLIGAWNGPAVWRYLPALLLPLTYAALGPPNQRRTIGGYLVFGAACSLALFTEADLIIYGMAGVALVIVGDIASGSWGSRLGEPVRGLLVDLLPVLAAGLLVFAFWLATDSVAGNLRFYGELPAVSASSSVNPFIAALFGYSLKPSLNAAAVACPVLLLTAGLGFAVLAPKPRRDVVSPLLAAAGVSFVLGLKNLNRPIGDQAFIMALIVVPWVAVLLLDRRRLTVIAASSALVAGLLSTLHSTNSGSLDRFLRTIPHAPAHALGVAKLPFDSSDVRRAAAERVTPRYYRGYVSEIAAKDYLKAVGSHGGRLPSFAVLGDAPLMYAFLDQAPPYQIGMYDASPIGEQAKVVSKLVAKRPRFMVWVDNGSTIDGIPYQVRDPLIYQYAVEHYVPYRRYGSIYILRRRRPVEPMAAKFWLHTLGQVDLGSIPSLSSGVDAADCSGGSGCNEYVTLSGPTPDSVEGLAVRIGGPRGAFRVTLNSQVGQTEYAIRLDRLWFAPLLGSHLSVRSENLGWTARLARRRTDDDLY